MALAPQLGPFLGTSVSSKPGVFQGLLESQPRTVNSFILTLWRDQLLRGVAGTGWRLSCHPSQAQASGLPREPRARPSGGPTAGKWSHLIQRKSVELRFNERACLPPRKEKRERPRKTQPGTLEDSGVHEEWLVQRLDHNVPVVMAPEEPCAPFTPHTDGIRRLGCFPEVTGNHQPRAPTALGQFTFVKVRTVSSLPLWHEALS